MSVGLYDLQSMSSAYTSEKVTLKIKVKTEYFGHKRYENVNHAKFNMFMRVQLVTKHVIVG